MNGRYDWSSSDRWELACPHNAAQKFPQCEPPLAPFTASYTAEGGKDGGGGCFKKNSRTWEKQNARGAESVIDIGDV